MEKSEQSERLLAETSPSSTDENPFLHKLPRLRPAASARTFKSCSSSSEGSASSTRLNSPDNSFNYFPEKRPLESYTSFLTKYESGTYHVETLPNYDNEEFFPAITRWLYQFSPLTTLLALTGYFVYFSYRVHCVRSAQSMSGTIFVIAWVFITVEVLLSSPAILHHLYQMLSIRGRTRPKRRLQGNIVPSVDVFITCCNEDIDVILDTTRAACAVDYPKDRFRIVILDDGKDSLLERAISDLSRDNPNLSYYARVKISGKPHHFKAGNLVGGTNHVTEFADGEGEYIASLDADMIPEPDWLRAILANMANDDKMGLVCPPALFYNIPDDDPLCQSLETLSHVQETTKDGSGAAWCTGSGYAIRRKALESIGGWPTCSIAEDTLTSALLLGAGWKTAYCHEALQYGEVPDNYLAHLKQRTRWSLGSIQSASKLNYGLWGSQNKHMPAAARLSVFMILMDSFFITFTVAALLTFPIVLLRGDPLVAYSSPNELRMQLRLCFLSHAMNRLNEWVTYAPSGWQLAQRDVCAYVWMAPYHALTFIRCWVLPSWLGGRSMGFQSTGSQKSQLNERCSATRAPVWRRLKVFLWDYEVYIHLFYVLLVVFAVVRSTITSIRVSSTLTNTLVRLLTHAFWPPCIWLVSLTAGALPLQYCLFPPKMPDREEMLDRDPVTGVARPKEHWKKQRFTKRSLWHEIMYVIITGHTTLLFILSFMVCSDVVEKADAAIHAGSA